MSEGQGSRREAPPRATERGARNVGMIARDGVGRVIGRGACAALAGAVALAACGGTGASRSAASGVPARAAQPAGGEEAGASALAGIASLPRPAHHDGLARALDSLLERASPAVGGVSLLVVRGDTVLYDRSHGAVAAGTAMPVASAAKWAGGALLAALADEGRLSFDDSVGRFLDAGSPMARSIRIGRLYSHTSGLPRTATCLADRSARLDPCAREILADGLVRRPGERFAYGGASMQVAARVAEVAGGGTWVRLFDERVARPLGMTATRWPGAMPHVAGGLVSSRDDYARLLRMLLDSGAFAGRRVLSPAAVAAMERDWRRGVAVEPPAPVRSFGYGIGMWIDRSDSTGRALELSSQGAFGFTPWIDRERALFGVLAVRHEGGPEAFELSTRVRAIVREMVR